MLLVVLFDFVVFFEEIFLIVGGILFALDDAHQVGSHAILAEHL